MHDMTDKLTTFYRRLDALYQTGDKAQVEEFLRRSMDEPELACPACNELGSLCRGDGRYEQSLSAFQRAEQLVVSQAGTDSGAYATVLNNMAGTYRLMGEYPRALSLFRQAMDIYAAAGLEDSYPYASALNNLALVHWDLGELDRAADCMERSLELMKYIPGHQREFKIGRENLARLREQINRREQA